MKRIVTCTAWVIVIALLLLVRAPAQAAVSAALTATTPNYTGPCPTTMAFTGSISGSPGTTFQYSFNRFINGVQQVQNVGAATMPASGTIAVSDSFSVASTSTGVNFDQIWVHNIPGQPDVYSNPASFAVKCGSSPTPPPGLGHITVAKMQTMLDPDDRMQNPAAPLTIQTNGDPKACAAHMANPFIAGLLCQPIAAAGKLFILWTWEPHSCFGCPQDVDGFKVYQTDAGMTSRTYLTQTSAGTSATVSVLNVPAGGFVGKCYAVSAYKGAKESSLGYRTCIGAAPTVGATTSTLQPSHIRYSGNTHSDCSGVFAALCSSEGNGPASGNEIRVGFFYASEKNIVGDSYFNSLQRAGVMFDLGSLVGRPLQRAVLHLHVHDTTIGSSSTHPTPKDSSKSCAAELGTGRGAWWTDTGWIEGDWTRNPAPGGPDVIVDVTNEVRSWMNGAPNFGFVLRGSFEDLSAFRKDVCMSDYDTASLVVDHF